MFSPDSAVGRRAMNNSRLPAIVSTGIDEEMPWSAVARHRFGKERRYVNRDLPRRYRATALQGGAHYAIMGARRFESFGG